MAKAAHIPSKAFPHCKNKMTCYLFLLCVHAGCNNISEPASINNQQKALPESDSNISTAARPAQYTAPCENSRYRTSIQPQGWID